MLLGRTVSKYALYAILRTQDATAVNLSVQQDYQVPIHYNDYIIHHQRLSIVCKLVQAFQGVPRKAARYLS